MRRPLVSLGVLETPQTSTSAIVQRFYPATRHMKHNNYDDAITPRSSEETHMLVINTNSPIDLKNGLTAMKPRLVVEIYPTISG